MLEEKGYPKDLISEAVYIDMVKGLIKALLGTQTTSAVGVDGGPDGLRLILKEQVLQYLLKKIGIDPNTTKGAIIRNGIEEALKTKQKMKYSIKRKVYKTKNKKNDNNSQDILRERESFNI